MESDAGVTRIEIVLTRPRLGWHPKPTIVIDGRGHPAQWGRGTWQVTPGTTVAVYLFNRLWRYGAAEKTLEAPLPSRVDYRAPILPLGRGRITA